MGEQNNIPSGEADQGVITDPSVDTTPWYETHITDEGLRGSPVLQKFQGIEPLAKGYIELEKRIGEKAGVQFPGEDATPEQWAEFHRQVPGYPEAPDKYGIEAPALPEGVTLPEGRFDGYLETAHSLGLTKAQAEGIAQWYGQNMATDLEGATASQEAMADQTFDALKQTWGANVDRNVAVAFEGMRREFGEEAMGFLDSLAERGENGQYRMLRATPQFVQMAYEWSRAKGYDRFVPGAPGGPPSKEAAQKAISDARQAVREGKMTSAEFDAIQARNGRIAYDQADDGLVMSGNLTGADFTDEQ